VCVEQASIIGLAVGKGGRTEHNRAVLRARLGRPQITQGEDATIETRQRPTLNGGTIEPGDGFISRLAASRDKFAA
jgi:hypothetical protein